MASVCVHWEREKQRMVSSTKILTDSRIDLAHTDMLTEHNRETNTEQMYTL